jgi:two-component system sensor histidine kinase YesM
MNQMISGNFNLFVKMFLILFISVSLPVTILGILSYNKSSQQLDNVMSSLIMENVKNNHNNLERLFKDVETFSESIIGSGKLEVFTNNAANFRQEEAYAFIRKAISITNEIQGPYELSIFPASAPQFKVLSQLVFPPESNQIEVNILV